MIGLLAQIARHRHAEASRYRGRAVSSAECVIDALVALRKTVEPAALSDLADLVPPASQYLVGIGLVAHVPNQPVFRCIKNVVECDRELYDPKARAEMSAADPSCIDGLSAELAGEQREL